MCGVLISVISLCLHMSDLSYRYGYICQSYHITMVTYVRLILLLLLPSSVVTFLWSLSAVLPYCYGYLFSLVTSLLYRLHYCLIITSFIILSKRLVSLFLYQNDQIHCCFIKIISSIIVLSKQLMSLLFYQSFIIILSQK